MTLWWTPSEVGAMEGRANQDVTVTDVDEVDEEDDVDCDKVEPLYLVYDESGQVALSSSAPLVEAPVF